ncbi:CAP domain-containing protein [Actinoplanes sp. LDG1-06]|uniref:CAP domain-containing protein n=1 Tax=Paractinoplanes ovalisporus TaxID=2810368 RepID=A0ABS2ANS7_9ACTN|nr:CAP domain-containing protein [Actinoplanes ovalisporus]MBM2620886.1 CAP domain-containing protein [Actinoplanes ovalisporus]
MPAHAARRARPLLIAAVAVGVIGVSYAGIAVAKSSSDNGEARLTAAAPQDPAPTDASTFSAEDLAAPVPPSSGTPSPSATGTATPTPTVKPSTTTRPTTTATKRPTKAPTKTTSPTKTKAPKPTRTTQPPTSGGGSSDTVTEVIRLVNVERKAAGCGSLTGETRLHRAAQKHSDRQADQDTMSHQLPGEASMGDRVTAEGYRWGGVAENVAAGYRTPADVMDGWMNSPGHKANILNCGYKNIGVGVAKSSGGTLYWTQNFASPL